jgi:hypothetical protein
MRADVKVRFSRIRGRLPCGEDAGAETKTGEEVVHSSRSSSKSHLCTEAGQPYSVFGAIAFLGPVRWVSPDGTLQNQGFRRWLFLTAPENFKTL